MNNKAKAGVSAPALALICTAEAAQVRTSIIRLLAVDFKRRSTDDLPQLPHGM